MRKIHELDPALPLSEAITACLLTPALHAPGATSGATPGAASGAASNTPSHTASNRGAGSAMRDRFQLGKTLLVVPGGRLARAVERRLLERSRAGGAVLEAPSIVTPLMLFGRFVVPSRPMLSRVGAEASWREAVERVAATDPALAARIAAAFASPDELPARLRPRLAARLARLSAEIASGMHSFASVREAIESLASRGQAEARLVEHWRSLEACAEVRASILDAAGVGDRDDALRDALLAEKSAISRSTVVPSGTQTARLASVFGFDRVVILFADPEPVHRALFRALEARGLSVELCVHATRDWSTERAPSGGVAVREPVIDDEGFPLRTRWANRVFGADVIAHEAIRVGEGPRDAAGEAVAAIRSIPAPRRSDEIAVMAPDDDTRRAIEAALGEAGSSAARVESRVFSSTRLGTLLSRLEALLGDGSMDAFAAYIRHPDVARALSGVGEECDVARYRVETIADSWRDGISAAYGAAGFRAMRDRVLTQVASLDGERAIADWARLIRAYLRSIVGEDASGAFVDERARSISALDRVLGEFADVPAAFATPIRCAEAIRLLRAAVDRSDIRGERREQGVSIVQWLDAGVADEPHLVLMGFADGAVPEGDVTDVLVPDAIRRTLGLLSSERRAARDAWILDGMLRRMHARRDAGLPASVQFVVARRTASGDPLRPSRFLLRVESTALAARVARLFPAEREVRPVGPVGPVAGRSVEFPVRPKVEGSVFTSISVTAFSTYLKCPYLFQLQRDPRLRLESNDERATELDARRFGNLLHKSVEMWGHDEKTRAKPTTDPAAIERVVLSHLDAAVARELPAKPSSAVRVQIEILRARLRRFAEMQAREAEAGWQVQFVELAYDENTGPLLLAASADPAGPARGLRLVGRIDRVDRHGESGAWRALDYKSGSAGDAPSTTHLRGKPGKRTWKDLQLPLYRHLLAEGRVEGMPPIRVESDGLGYINLAASAERSGFRMLDCTPAEFDMAYDEARRVVDGVLRGDFTPAERTPFPPDDPLAAVWGLGLRAQALGLDPGDGGSDEEASGAASVGGGA